MILAILGRQPELGIAELEAIHGSSAVNWFSPHTALVETDDLQIERLGGSQKIGRVQLEANARNWSELSTKIVQYFSKHWATHEGKLTLGISAYGFDASARDVQKTGIILKQKLKKSGVNLRLIPNAEPALSSATSHHNKLGLAANKVELIVVRDSRGRVLVAESLGAQNITALARRDQGRPKRDAFVGMLPPKLAMMIINLATAEKTTDKPQVVLDPFCGTGVVLQEAALMGYNVYGTDLSEKMIDFSRQNLDWLKSSHRLEFDYELQAADAIEATWSSQINAVATETYLGQPFSAPPSPTKLAQVRRNCNHIISQFLINLSDQIKPGTPLCVAVPAWRHNDGSFSHLPLIEKLAEYGYERRKFKNIKPSDLLYHRPDQIVARELLVLTKK